MIREVDLVSYLPPFMQEYNEPVAALEAENPEFTIIWTATDRVLKNRFIATADEYGISRFESMLGIYPSEEDTLESRRSRVQSKWFTTIPYTIKVLLQKLTILCADTDFTLTNNFETGYTLTLVTDLELYGQVEELENIINTMIPCNIVVDSQNSIPCNVRGAVLFGGGVVYVNEFIVTGSFKEIFEISGVAKIGGGVSGTTKITVSNDFSETVKADANANLASGVVYVDFIEIQTS